MAISGSVQRPFGQLAYEDNGAGQALVFAHGLGGNHLSWWQQIAHFKERYRCIAFSHRGFAPSSPVPGGPDPKDYADDVAALLDHLSIERAVMIGQSMGGWTTFDFGMKHPKRLAGAVFACTTGGVDYNQAPHMKLGEMAEWNAFRDREVAAGQADSVHPACGRRMAAEQPALHELYKQIDRLNAGLDKGALLTKLFETRTRPPSDLERIAAHLMFIAGAEDIVIPACGVEAVARSIAHARFARVDDAGHSVYFERAGRFNDAVDSYLSAINYV